ncbi:MAG: RNA degradosome polyphosphate kinase, partial [Parabacteroides sp.]|nr:RNA degradosome polyphosphate kinase [Parabacteroides sp.]
MDKEKKDKKGKEEKYYLPRDISWMYFNRRILQEAMKETVPVLERLSFLGIYSNNLDEFFRVRVASQNRIAECEEKSARKEQQEARQVLKQINKLNARYAKTYETAVQSVTEALRAAHIHLVNDCEVDEEQAQFLYAF